MSVCSLHRRLNLDAMPSGTSERSLRNNMEDDNLLTAKSKSVLNENSREKKKGNDQMHGARIGLLWPAELLLLCHDLVMTSLRSETKTVWGCD